MKILLSSSVKHFDPISKKVLIRHSVGVLVELFSQVLEEFGDVTYIGDADSLQGQEFDLIVSWPRNFNNLTTYNKFKKSICFFNIAEGGFLKRALREEATRLGCKVSDCFAPLRYLHADLNFLIGGNSIIKQYTDAGVDPKKIVPVYYRHGYIPWKSRDKNPRPVFIHIATTLGLRKGFWHVLKDFEDANLDAELWCVGKIEKERFWVDLAKKYENHPKIKVIGWVDNHEQRYIDLIHGADFIFFPSFGEGQPGSVIESMEGGCLPITTDESGIPYHPFGVYTRGDSSTLVKAANCSNSDFRALQDDMKVFIDSVYDNESFKNTVREEIKKLL
jgi:glycosyltransferase involved in cell wall biosynthesis